MKFILWFIIIILIFRMLRKSIFFSVYRSYNDQMKSQMQGNENQNQRKPEGTVTIVDPKQVKGKKKEDGDFVDYEELK